MIKKLSEKMWFGRIIGNPESQKILLVSRGCHFIKGLG
jgi:hypothetical protein